MKYETYDELKLTKAQLKAAESVYKAMRKCHKLGIDFWDDYGTLTCYNAKKIIRLNMDGRTPKNVNIREHNITYYELLDNFSGGNSDDDVWAELRL